MTRYSHLSRFLNTACAVSTILAPLRTPAQSAIPESAPMVFGQPTAPLYGPWKFHIGDSPVAAHSPAWADPSFDDSTWEQVDLTPGKTAFDPIGGYSGYVPGWTARGHAGYSGYAWYRIRLHVDVRPDERLALAGPADVDDGYQVYANGSNIGSFGDFSGKTPTTGVTQPMIFQLPEDTTSGPEPQTLLLAFRVWMHPGTLLIDPDGGGIHTAPVIGEASAITALYRLSWLDYIRSAALSPVAAVALAGLAVMAFCLIFFDRSDAVYLRIGTVFLLEAIFRLMNCLYLWTPMTGLTYNLIVSPAISLEYAGWAIVWWFWFGRRPRWVPRAAIALAVANMVALSIGLEQFFFLHPVADAFHTASVCCRVLFLLLYLRVVIPGIQRQGRYCLEPALKAPIRLGQKAASSETFM